MDKATLVKLMESKQPDRQPDEQQSAVTPTSEKYLASIGRDDAISMLMQISQSIGKIEVAVATLTKELDEVKKKVSRFDKILYAGWTLLVCFIVAGGWMLNTAKDIGLMYLKATIDAPKPLVVVPPTIAPPLAPKQ